MIHKALQSDVCSRQLEDIIIRAEESMPARCHQRASVNSTSDYFPRMYSEFGHLTCELCAVLLVGKHVAERAEQKTRTTVVSRVTQGTVVGSFATKKGFSFSHRVNSERHTNQQATAALKTRGWTSVLSRSDPRQTSEEREKAPVDRQV